MQETKSLIGRIRERVFAPVDVASLVFFRSACGLLFAWDAWMYFADQRIALYWIEPRFLFKYYGFSWVQPWPGNGLYIHWIVLGVLAVFIAVGFLYRLSTVLFFLGSSYAFLLDQSRWLNHSFL